MAAAMSRPAGMSDGSGGRRVRVSRPKTVVGSSDVGETGALEAASLILR